jgi:hypothetical protein
MRNLSQILWELAGEVRTADQDPDDPWPSLAESLERFSKWQERLCDCQCVRERREEILGHLLVECERTVSWRLNHPGVGGSPRRRGRRREDEMACPRRFVPFLGEVPLRRPEHGHEGGEHCQFSYHENPSACVQTCIRSFDFRTRHEELRVVIKCRSEQLRSDNAKMFVVRISRRKALVTESTLELVIEVRPNVRVKDRRLNSGPPGHAAALQFSPMVQSD